MNIAAATPAERLAAYRSRHRIEIDASGDWTTCATDGIKVYPVRGRQWRHDQDAIAKLEREAYAASAMRPGAASPRCESGGRFGCTCDVCF